jgi:hypothetical protein
MGHGSENDIDFILRREWIGVGSAPGMNPVRTNEQYEINQLLHLAAPSFLRDGNGSTEDVVVATSINLNGLGGIEIAEASPISLFGMSFRSLEKDAPMLRAAGSGSSLGPSGDAPSEEQVRRSIESSIKSASSLKESPASSTKLDSSMDSAQKSVKLQRNESQKSMKSISIVDSNNSSIYQLDNVYLLESLMGSEESGLAGGAGNVVGGVSDVGAVETRQSVVDTLPGSIETRDSVAIDPSPDLTPVSALLPDPPRTQPPMIKPSQGVYNDSGLSRIISGTQGSYNDGGLGALIANAVPRRKVKSGARPRSNGAGGSNCLRELFSALEAEMEVFGREEANGDKGIGEVERELDGILGEGRRVYEGE